MKAMVLAAGVGSRLEPLTSQVPKPLVPIANVPVMEHILTLLKDHGITEIASNLHHLPEKLIERFGDGSALGINLRFHHEKELSGDAGGVRACRDFLASGTFLVIMGDLLTDCDISYVVKEHKRKKALATIAIKQVDDVSQFGVVLADKEGFITGFQEKPPAHEALSNLASTGIYVFEPEIFEHLPKTGVYGFGRQLFPTLVKQGEPVLAVEFSSYWSDVGTIKQYRQSNFDALNGLIKVRLPGEKTNFGWLGAGAQIDKQAQIEGTLMLGAGSRVKAGARLRGTVVVGDNCTIEEDCLLEDTIIWSGTKVEARAHLKDSVFGSNCVVGMGSKHEEAAAVAPVPSQPVSSAV